MAARESPRWWASSLRTTPAGRTPIRLPPSQTILNYCAELSVPCGRKWESTTPPRAASPSYFLNYRGASDTSEPSRNLSPQRPAPQQQRVESKWSWWYPTTGVSSCGVWTRSPAQSAPLTMGEPGVEYALPPQCSLRSLDVITCLPLPFASSLAVYRQTTSTSTGAVQVTEPINGAEPRPGRRRGNAEIPVEFSRTLLRSLLN
jgi:hypothetical protein